MIGKNMTKLINMLNENEWKYEIRNNVFYMILSNDEEIFCIYDENRAKKLIEILKNW